MKKYYIVVRDVENHIGGLIINSNLKEETCINKIY